MSLHIVAPAKIGLPYGHYPRLLTAWIGKEAVQTRSPVLELGDSLSAFMAELGLAPTGGRWGSIPRLQEHMKRFFCSTFSLTAAADDGEFGLRCSPVKAYRLWWDPKRPDQGDLWRSTIELSADFYEAILKQPVPLDMRVLRSLAHERSPLAIDIYAWLNWKMWRVSKTGQSTGQISWGSLALQFGGEYGRARDFKAKFIERLRLVLSHYQGWQLDVSDVGLVLHPSPLHIPPRA